jgi:sporulation protein YlmC with PRC-barrel domain
MLINFQDLKSLPVETENGTPLGVVVDLEINLETHEINKYVITKQKLLSTGTTLLISPQQIIRITAEKIIVQDELIREKNSKKSLLEKISTEKQPASVNAELNQ